MSKVLNKTEALSLLNEVNTAGVLGLRADSRLMIPPTQNVKATLAVIGILELRASMSFARDMPAVKRKCTNGSNDHQEEASSHCVCTARRNSDGEVNKREELSQPRLTMTRRHLHSLATMYLGLTVIGQDSEVDVLDAPSTFLLVRRPCLLD